jgi:hypothetical protein
VVALEAALSGHPIEDVAAPRVYGGVGEEAGAVVDGEAHGALGLGVLRGAGGAGLEEVLNTPRSLHSTPVELVQNLFIVWAGAQFGGGERGWLVQLLFKSLDSGSKGVQNGPQ